jgi:hypothetical protein
VSTVMARLVRWISGIDVGSRPYRQPLRHSTLVRRLCAFAGRAPAEKGCRSDTIVLTSGQAAHFKTWR